MGKNAYGIDWSDIDLDSGYERDLPMLDNYTFENLLLEVNCNIPNINEDSVRKQFNESLESKITSCKEIFEDNLENIVNYAIEYRKDK